MLELLESSVICLLIHIFSLKSNVMSLMILQMYKFTKVSVIENYILKDLTSNTRFWEYYIYLLDF